MKILPEHYAHMKAQIQQVCARVDPEEYRKQVIAEGKANDPDKRVRWDYAYAAGLTKFICDNIYSYADDSHIDTALRAIMREGSMKP